MMRIRRRSVVSSAPVSQKAVRQAAHRAAVETLERRTLLCALPHDHTPPIELPFTPLPEGAFASESSATILWTNRGQTSDGFAATFGGNAETARKVIDQVLRDFERLIGSFNYSDGSNTYELTVNMSGNHNGASANLNATLNGKPKRGTITMGKGSNGFGGGWFIDPTPHEHSEFMGGIVNAFSGDAQAGSPAMGLGDFYTVAAAEITHVLGLMGSQLPMWSSRTTNTGIPDTAEGGGRGTFYVFQGPSIKHLLTSNNGGPNGSNFGSAVHGAGPGVPVNFGGETYLGAQDIGNAIYEFSRRYIPSRTFALMFKDAFNYSTVDPSTFGTFYSVLNESTGQVLVRGGAGSSADSITISTSGNTLYVSVDIGDDVPGTGHLAGAGNLPAFVSEYDLSQVSSILIQPGDGNDTIDIQNLPAGLTINVEAGTGNDTIRIGGGDLAANLLGTFNINGQTGTDTIVFDDSNSSGDFEYILDGNTFSRTGLTTFDFSSWSVEGVHILAGGGNNTIRVNSVPFGRSATVKAGPGDDTIFLGSGQLVALAGPVTVDGQAGSDTVILDDSTTATAQTYAVTATNITRAGFSLSYSNVSTLRLNADAANSAVTVNSTAAETTLIINGGGGTDVINVVETSPSSVVVVESSPGSDQVSVNTDGNGQAAVRFDSDATRLGSLTIGAGGRASLPDGHKVLVTSNLTINGSGVLDVNDGSFIWDYSGGNPLNTLRSLLTSGHAGGAWNGAGINSTDAANDPSNRKALGYAAATELFSSFPASFAGQQIDNTTLLVRRTLYGDLNLDGQVNLADFNRLASNFGAAGNWSQGNINFDSTINLNDFNLLAMNFGMSIDVGEGDSLAAVMAPPASTSSLVSSVDTGAGSATKRRGAKG